MDTQFDTVIVGAGAAGLLMATRLAEAGQNVAVLEAGPERKLNDLVSSQIWARKLKWADTSVAEAGNHAIGHAFNSGSGTGGSAVHHYGVWLRLRENDFSVASDHGVGLDWPIDYDTLRPHYDRVQREIGISGDAEAEIGRPPGDPYPLPPLPVFSQGRVLQKGFEKAGLTAMPVPMAINSQPYQGRRACLYDGWCDAGCPIGALANPLAVWLPRAQAAGITLLHNAKVVRVLRSSTKQSRITGVDYLSGGETHTIKARDIVIAAFTVQSTRILLNSKTDSLPAPGNREDQLGRYLTTHPAATVFGLFEEETLPHQGVTGGQLLCHDHYAEKDQGDAFGSSQWIIANAIKPNDLLGYGTSRPDIRGPALKPWLERAARHLGNMTLVTEDIAQADNRITLSENRDADGVPGVSTIHNLRPETIALWERRVKEGKKLFELAGADEVWNGPRAPMHIMGGTVMGNDESASVTDHMGRVHDTDNLYVAGPSLFPSTGAVNPTFTLSALASRQADHLIRKYS
ncbi:glucose-methanol-choline oxidoreductase [Luminiphilus syltensis NOR5-1B]|uniref:Glucose-methanol-choline oxidoreductase n=1 Tax=Luminiphilus syltensis NOR5-1B TaxID=565045 RepID=B8KTB3_9GAMM|nr:GMC family oxidoreductase [Luminiphilus syltensis]EED36931.1 glucose-methanol-choline oxidoreductase [Luminiphilus syltensis NOR5-1B]